MKDVDDQDRCKREVTGGHRGRWDRIGKMREHRQFHNIVEMKLLLCFGFFYTESFSMLTPGPVLLNLP